MNDVSGVTERRRLVFVTFERFEETLGDVVLCPRASVNIIRAVNVLVSGYWTELAVWSV